MAARSWRSSTAPWEIFRFYGVVRFGPAEMCLTSGTMSAEQGEELRQLTAVAVVDPDPVDWRSFRLVCLT